MAADDQRAGGVGQPGPARTADRSRPYFFIHVMKTAGSSFRQHIHANFATDEVYPDRDLGWGDYLAAYGFIEPLLSMSAEEHRRYAAYTGHFPFSVTQILDRDLVTMTLLREPVARTVSYLKHCRKYQPHHHDSTFEEIYEDVANFSRFIWNHQVRVFAWTPDDTPVRVDDVIEIDDERMEIARRNLAAVDLVGLTEHYDEFLDEVGERWGWTIGGGDRRNVGIDAEVPQSLVDRIAEDNEADLEFYDYAVDLWRRRRGTRGVAGGVPSHP